MIQPNFFIAGAVRSGTTAMYTYLDEHLKIFMGRPKDGNFFSEDFDGLRTVTTWADYNRMFKDAQPEHRAVGEASALYLHSDMACAAIREYRPGAKIIVLLREPARLVESLHAQMYYTGDEDEADFEAAWRLQEERAEGRRIPPRCRAAARPSSFNTVRWGCSANTSSGCLMCFLENRSTSRCSMTSGKRRAKFTKMC